MVSRASKILVIGYNAFDISLPFNGLPSLDSKNQVSQIRFGGGGPGATAALALARLGAEVKLITPLTDDFGGRVQQQELKEGGVDLTLSPVLAGYNCPRAVILIQPETAERTIFWARGDLPQIPKEYWRDHWLDGVDLLYLDGHEPEISLVAARRAKVLGLPVVFDAGSVRESSRELVQVCSDVISSAIFAPALTGVEDPQTALKQLQDLGPSRVAMTLGSNGVLGCENVLFHEPSFQVPVVDSTGAGDVFHAGYAYSLVCGEDFVSNLVFASAAAAIKCTHWGARGGLPTLCEVREMVKNGVRNPIVMPLLED